MTTTQSLLARVEALTIPRPEHYIDNDDAHERINRLTEICRELADENRKFRKWMEVRYSGASNLYFDDGELQDHSGDPLIDYMRDSFDTIVYKMLKRYQASETAKGEK